MQQYCLGNLKKNNQTKVFNMGKVLGQCVFWDHASKFMCQFYSLY